MSEQGNQNHKQRRDDERAALIAAQIVIIYSGIYWFLSIEDVLALLELAYG